MCSNYRSVTVRVGTLNADIDDKSCEHSREIHVLDFGNKSFLFGTEPHTSVQDLFGNFRILLKLYKIVAFIFHQNSLKINVVTNFKAT